jgi:hypothetical protein
MRRYRTGARTLVALLLLAGGGLARAQTTLAVLGVEPIGVPEPLAMELTEALRQRAAATPGLRLVPGKDLIELKMIFGCERGAASCMAQAGRSLGADKLLYGTLKRGMGGVTADLKLLDVPHVTVEKTFSETVPKRDLVAVAPRWFSTLVQIDARPTLTITSEPPNATVLVDDQPAGQTPLTLRDLAPGTHSLTLSAPGRVTERRTLAVEPAGTYRLSLALEPEPPPAPVVAPPAPVVAPPPQVAPPAPIVAPPVQAPEPAVVAPPPARPAETLPPAGHPGRAAKAVALAAVAAAAVAGGVAIYTWRTYRDLEDQAHKDLLTLQPASPTAAEAAFLTRPNCSPPSSLGGSAAAQKYKNDCQSGQSYADATTALWVVAGALAVGGVVSFVIGDRQAAHAREKPRGTAALLKQSLRIAPVFSTQSGGLQAAFEF